MFFYLILIFFNINFLFSHEINKYSFDEHMSKYEIYDVESANKSVYANSWKILRNLFDTNIYKLRNFSSLANYQIPKRIHQIWLGSKFPEEFKKWQESLKNLHPDWEYKLWTDSDALVFKLKNKKYFDEAKNQGAKSDIFRYEILERYGGVYLDIDFEGIEKLDILHKYCSFYTGIGYLQQPLLYNGIIGAVPNHPIIKACVDNITNIEDKNNSDAIQLNTGPIYFTIQFFNNISICRDKVVAFPPNFFYPLPINSKEYIDNCEKMAEYDKKYLTCQTFVKHYWTCTWVEKDSYLNRKIK